MKYTAKNLLWGVIVTLYIVCFLLLGGCATEGQWVSIRTISHSAKYQRDCVGPNAMFTWYDRECMMPQEPQTQVGQVQRVDMNASWRTRQDILIWCRAYPDLAQTERACSGIPPVRNLVSE